MFAPSSSDDDGASRDDCGAHLETLTRLACQAQTLVADLLFAADAQDATFQLDRHPERADALFDFEYLRRPSACDARLSVSPALRRVDETCRAACRSSVWRAYRSLANVVRWRTSFVAFCESLRERDEKKRFGDASSDESDAGFVDRSYDSDTRHDVTDESENERDEGDFGGDVVDDRTHEARDGDGRRFTRRARRKEEPREKNKRDPPTPTPAPSFRAASRDFRFRQMIRELVSLFASALLIVETRLEAPFLERVVVQRARWSEEEAKAEREAASSKNEVAFDPPEWDDVVALVSTKTTKSDRSGSSRCLRARPVPGAGAFAQFGLPDFVVELVVRSGGVLSAPQKRRRLRKNVANAERDDAEDDARGAAEVCACLFFAPETLRSDHGHMRDIVDAHFFDAFVVLLSSAGGLVVDLTTTWFPFEAARRALARSRALAFSGPEAFVAASGVLSGGRSEAFSGDVRFSDSRKNGGAFEDLSDGSDSDPTTSGSFFAHAGRRAAAANLVAERAARLTDAAKDVAIRLSRFAEEEARLSDAFTPSSDENVFFHLRDGESLSAESLSASLVSLEALNAAAAWLFAHAHAEDTLFREAFANNAPAPEAAVDATLDAAELERVLLEALDKALRVKNETWTRAKARAAANAEALVRLSSGFVDGRDGRDGRDDVVEHHETKATSYRDDAPRDDAAAEEPLGAVATPTATPTKPVPSKKTNPATPATPKTPARVPRRARYAKIRARLDALPEYVSPSLDSSAAAREVASIARALERVEEEEASRASRDRMLLSRQKESSVDEESASAEGINVDDEESRWARARAHASALRASLATARQAASLHDGYARALEATRDLRFRGAGPGGIDRGVLDEHVPYLRSRLAASPASVARKVCALVAKLARATERRTLRHFHLEDRGGDEDDGGDESDRGAYASARRVSDYYARDVLAFAEEVLRAAPETALDALDAVSSSDSLDRETGDRASHPDAAGSVPSSRAARLALAAASAKAAALADGLLRVPRVCVFSAWLDPRDVLARGLRDALRRRITATFRETLTFDPAPEPGLFGGASRRDATPAEFLAKLRLCQRRVARHKASFVLAASFCAGGDAHALLSVAADEEFRNAVESDLSDETFMGRTLRELLRLTDPRRARFMDARSGYVLTNRADYFSVVDLSSSPFSASAANPSTRGVGPETFDCLADLLGDSGVRLARALLADRAESSLQSLLAFYGDKMDGGAAEVLTRVVAAAGPEARFESTRDARVAADDAIAEAVKVFEEASFFAEMREWCVDVGHVSLASRAVKAAAAAARRESARGARRARDAAATLKRASARASARASDEGPNGSSRVVGSEGAWEGASHGALNGDVSRWSTLMFLFALSSFPSCGASGRLAPTTRDERGFAPDAAAITVGVLSVLARLDAGVSCARADTSPSSSRRSERKETPASVSDSDDDADADFAGLEKNQVGPFVAAYLGCLARHLRRFAARRGAGGARGYGGTPSSIADALSAALVAATRASPSLGAGTSTSPMSPFAGVFGGGGAAEEEEASTCAEWLETTCRVGQIPRRALYAHAPPYVLDNASTRVLEE